MRGEGARHEMFAGVARRHGWSDTAVVGIWLALAIGFIAEVTPRAIVPRATGPALMASAVAPPAQGRRTPLGAAVAAPGATGAEQAECSCP